MRTTYVVCTAALISMAFSTAASASSSGECPAGQASIEDVADGLNAVQCPEVVGDLVVVGDIGVPVPDPGSGIALQASATDGLEVSLSVEVSAAGAVSAEIEAPPGAFRELRSRVASHTRKSNGAGGVTFEGDLVGGLPGPASPGKCSDSTYVASGQKWSSGSVTYRVNRTENVGMGVSGATFDSAASSAATTIDTGADSCGIAGTPSLSISAGSNTTLNSNINGAANTCASSGDGVNVVDFGNLTGSYLGLACSRWSGTSYTEVDIRLDNSSRTWAGPSASCSGAAYDLQSVLTHEFGHFVGLKHTNEYGTGDLVMSPKSSACDATQRKLGKGDLLGLLAIY